MAEAAAPAGWSPFTGCTNAAAAPVACPANPCLDAAGGPAVCPAADDVTCHLNDRCPAFAYGGLAVPLCGALWTRGGDHAPVHCEPAAAPEVTDVAFCPIGAPQPGCRAEFRSPCRNATCAAHPTARCVQPGCDKLYRGTLLEPCPPVWVDAASGDLVECGAATPAPGTHSTAAAVPAATTPPGCNPPGTSPACAADACVDPLSGGPMECFTLTGGMGGDGGLGADLVCAANTRCEAYSYQGLQVPPCGALWTLVGRPVHCDMTEPTVTDINLCPIGVPVSTCPAAKRDACRGATCPAHPAARCVLATCDKIYRGVRLSACDSAWLDEASGALVDCGPDPTPVADDLDEPCPANATVTCPDLDPAPGGGYACPADASCPGSPSATCTVRSCRTVYRGALVLPCEAVWVDGRGEVLDEEGCAERELPEGCIDPADAPGPCPAAAVAPCTDPDATCPFAASLALRPDSPPPVCSLNDRCGAVDAGGLLLPRCAEVWRLGEGGPAIHCGLDWPNVSDIHLCPLGVPVASCPSDSKDVCGAATCPAHPTARCVQPICSKLYRGALLEPCTAYWVDEATGELVECGTDPRVTPAPAPAPSLGAIPRVPASAPALGAVPQVPAFDPFAGCPLPATAAAAAACDPLACAKAVAANAGFACPTSFSPGVTCHINTRCAAFAYRGVQVPLCGALFVDPPTREPVVCTTPNVTDIGICPMGVPVVSCRPEDRSLCRNATCVAHPDARCVQTGCDKYYRGALVRPCRAYWVRNATGDLIANCTAPAPAAPPPSPPARAPPPSPPSCASCPTAYTPVCGTDGNTYPSRCAAQCLGKAVRKEGRCGRCRGAACTTARLKEICSLGTKQCQPARRLECRVPAGEAAQLGGVYGRCARKA